jgi:hypothetical protein
MDTRPDAFEVQRWARNLEQFDREVGRLALLCRVRVLDRGVIERILQRDSSVCGTNNPIAFRKLHDLLSVYFAVRQKSSDALGPLKTAEIETYVIEQLKKSFPDLGGPWPPV